MTSLENFQSSAFDLSQVPAYSGNPVAVINDNKPFVTLLIF